MAKIWEVDFTKQIGTSGAKFEANVGPNLTGDTGISVIPTLPGFGLRPGVLFPNDNSADYYDLTVSGLTNYATFTGAYTKRSFVIWFYLTSETTESDTYLWGEGNATTLPDDGLLLQNRIVNLRGGGGYGPGVDFGVGTTVGWHSIVVTMDRTVASGALYADGSLISNTGAIAAASKTYQYIGHSNTSRESEFYLGYVATYDHILNASEVSAIHDTFLVDRLVADPPAVLSGTVFDTTTTPISGADVFLMYNDNPYVVADYTQTDGSGYYELGIPFLGDYTVVSSNPPTTSGARAISITLSGGPTSTGIIYNL